MTNEELQDQLKQKFEAGQSFRQLKKWASQVIRAELRKLPIEIIEIDMIKPTAFTEKIYDYLFARIFYKDLDWYFYFNRQEVISILPGDKTREMISTLFSETVEEFDELIPMLDQIIERDSVLKDFARKADLKADNPDFSQLGFFEDFETWRLIQF